MASENPAPLLAPDHGIDASDPMYPLAVTAVLTSLTASSTQKVDEHTQLAARTVDALNEVAEWAQDGFSADPTACMWLSYLRWARCNGVHLPESAPVPPTVEFDRFYPTLASPSQPTGDSLTALAMGAMGEVARPTLPHAASSEVLTRSMVLGLIPNLGWRALVPIVVDGAAITHGDPEAQIAATCAALSVHAALRARTVALPLREVLAQVYAVTVDLTRPAPLTQTMLELCLDPQVSRDLEDPASHLRQRISQGVTATQALGLAWAALLSAAQDWAAADVGDEPTPSKIAQLSDQAHAMVKRISVSPRAALVLVDAIIAARWPELTHPENELPSATEGSVIGELTMLAQAWCQRWRPQT